MVRSAKWVNLFQARSWVLYCGILLPGLLLLSCTGKQSPPPPRSEIGTQQHRAPEQRERFEPGSLPNSRLTPGATLDVTKEDICTVGYTKKVRDVPVPVKRQAYSEYNVAYIRGAYEVDHLIPLELGGSNSLRNLWPEAYNLVWGAHVKDQLENRLHELVCQGSLPLQTAQNWISQDWIGAYRRVFHTRPPLRQRTAPRAHTARRRNDYQP